MKWAADQRVEAPGLALAGVVLVCAAVGVRMLATMDPFPGWSGDPLLMETPIVGLTPASSLAVDAVMTVGAGLVLAGMARAGRGPRWWEAVLAGVGVAWAWWHGAWAGGGSLQDLVLGASWSAGVLAGLSAAVAGRDARLGRLMGAVLLALAVPLVLRGIVQVTVEHPDVVEAFRRDQGAILAAHGWSEDSPMARAYERRLTQAEASGWFGLANVYATVMAASAAGLVGSAAGAWRSGKKGTASVLLAGAAGALVGVLLAGSKGGWAAGALGAGLVAAGLVTPGGWRGRVGAVLGLGVVASALGAVVARGLIGERLGELSLLFRWFYMEGAARVIGRWPIAGVGPTGFKEAYALLKPAASPEDVSSPHSVLLDWAATLGVGGAAWGVLWLAWVRRAGSGLMRVGAVGGEDEAGPDMRPDMSLAAVMLVVPTLAGSMLERALASPTTALVRVGGAVLGMVLAGAVMRAGRGLRQGLCAGALAAAAHAQIEMTAVTPGSCAWLMVVVGVAGGMMGGLKSTENTKNMEDMKTSDPEDGVRGTGWIGVSLCVAFVGWLTAEMPGVVRWERALREGYERVAVVAELEGRMRAVETGRTGDTRAKIVEDLAGALGEPGLLGRPLTGQEVAGAVLRLRVGRSAEALRALQRAGEEWPTDVATVQAWSRLELLQASQMKASGREAEAREHAGRAVAVAEMYAGPRGAAAWSWLGTTREAVWELTGDRGMLEGAVTCWEQAAAGAPHAVLHPLQLARGCARLGRKEEAGVWARRALENDAKTRLDPLAGLSAGARKEMEGLAR